MDHADLLEAIPSRGSSLAVGDGEETAVLAMIAP
jgi:hypothetical protein